MNPEVVAVLLAVSNAITGVVAWAVKGRRDNGKENGSKEIVAELSKIRLEMIAEVHRSREDLDRTLLLLDRGFRSALTAAQAEIERRVIESKDRK